MKKIFYFILLIPTLTYAGHYPEVKKIRAGGGMEGFKFYNVRCTRGGWKTLQLMEADGKEVLEDEYSWGTTRMRVGVGITLEDAARRACLDID